MGGNSTPNNQEEEEEEEEGVDEDRKQNNDEEEERGIGGMERQDLHEEEGVDDKDHWIAAISIDNHPIINSENNQSFMSPLISIVAFCLRAQELWIRTFPIKRQYETLHNNDNSNNNNNNNLRSNAYLDEDIQVEDLENIDDVPTFRNTNNQHSEGTDGPSHRIFAAIPPPNNNNNKSSTTTSKTSTVAAVTTEEKSKTTTISYNIESGNSITTSTL
jgi:hypothetical protein